MIVRLFIVAIPLLALSALAEASTTVINISTQLGANPVQFDAGNGNTGVGYTLLLNEGDYEVSPLNSTRGGTFTAANRFGFASPPSRGWEWSYFLAASGLGPIKVGFGGGEPDGTFTYQTSPEAAFSLAPSYSFHLDTTRSVTFYWLDDRWNDNVGGISLAISAVPEPSNPLLYLTGTALLLAYVNSRARAVK